MKIINTNINLLSYCAIGQKSEMCLSELKSNWSTRISFFLEARVGNQFSCLFQLLEAIHIPSLMASFLHLQSQQQWAKSFSHCHLASPSSVITSFYNHRQERFSTFKDLYRPSQTIQGNLHRSRWGSLISVTYFKPFLQCKVLGIKMWKSLVGVIILPTTTPTLMVLILKHETIPNADNTKYQMLSN